MPGPVVDTESAREFMREALAQIGEDEQERIVSELEAKHARFHALLSRPGFSGSISAAELVPLLRLVFATRRRVAALVDSPLAEGLPAWIDELVHAAAPVEARFQAFCDRLAGLPEALRHDLASELLHFTAPDEYWLWTRWVWDTGSRTGALALVTQDYELGGASLGETYLRVGRATAFVQETARAAGLARGSRFGLDVFLACVYCVYVYTAVRMKMTREFNRVIPELPELARRFLGVHRMES